MTDQEREAIGSLRNGDSSGLETLVWLHQVRSLRIACSLTGNRQMAEDIVADAFLTAYDRIGQFDPCRPFGPWFDRIVINSTLMTLRKAKSGPRIDDVDAYAQHIDPAPAPEAAALLHEQQLVLRDTVWALPPKQRAVLVLRYYLGMDERAIAQTLACPLGTVKWRLHAARARMRHNLEQADGRGWDYILKGETT